MRRSLPAIAAITLATVALVGCASPQNGGSSNAGLTEADIVGTWGETELAEPHLVFDEGGTVSGTDGCNNLTGQWKIDSDTIVLSKMATTKKYCEGVDTWLTRAATATVEDDDLVIADEDGGVIGSLDRT
jgi:heat shock protein HslJ